jgi:hyperosmotically inducible periplasmic protein
MGWHQRAKALPAQARPCTTEPSTQHDGGPMKQRTRTAFLAFAFVAAILAISPVVGWAKTSELPPTMKRQTANDAVKTTEWLQRKVRHELVMLPYYGVFDNITYRVEDDRVELLGQVRRPTLKSDAARVVEQIEGVSAVVNNIEVLPLSPNDDRIRLGVYRAIYGSDALFRYDLQPVPSIHIIVKNGHVTLEGIAANEMDKNIANLKAHGVPGVFSIAQNIVVENK